MEYVKIGILYDFEMVWDIVRGKDLEYYLIDNNRKLEKFLWKRRVYCLSEPWERIIYYTDDLGVHYNCIIYDGIEIDIYAENIEELLNTICNMISIPKKLLDKINDIEE